jgi:hypothetical protein
LFIVTPLSGFFKTSLFMKIIILIILGYTIYLNNKQTNLLRDANQLVESQQIKSHYNTTHHITTQHITSQNITSHHITFHRIRSNHHRI